MKNGTIASGHSSGVRSAILYMSAAQAALLLLYADFGIDSYRAVYCKIMLTCKRCCLRVVNVSKAHSICLQNRLIK